MPENEDPAPVPEAPGFPWLRLLAGLGLTAAVVAAILYFRSPSEIRLEARCEPPDLLPGGSARLILEVSPRRGLRDGPLQNVNVRLLDTKDLVFERDRESLLPDEKAMILPFAVGKDAHPGPRRLVMVISAQLGVGPRRSVARTVESREEVVVAVGAQEEGKQ